LSKAEYARVLAGWNSTGRAPDPKGRQGLTVAGLMLAYHAARPGVLRRPGRGPDQQVTCIKESLKPARQIYGHRLARKIGPLALKAVRQGMIGAKLARTTINSRVGRIMQMFK
jgi:hypothetical protein